MAKVTERRAGKESAIRATDLFISGVDRMEMIGSGLVRVTFFVNVGADSGGLEAVIAEFSLVMPLSAMPDAIGKAIATTARTIIANADGVLTLMQ